MPPTATALPPFASGADMSAYSKGQQDPSDPSIQLTLEAVSAALRSYCGWHIFPAVDLVLTLDTPGGRELSLPSRQVNDVTAVRNLTVEPSTTWETTSYRWSRLGQVHLTGTTSYWPNAYRGVEVEFNSGYDEAPPELRLLCLQVAARALASPTGVTREQAGQVSISYAMVAPGVSGGMLLLGDELALLDVYRIVGA